jgi:hypothetical protein
MSVAKPKRHKSPGADEIPAELFKACGRTTRSEIHKLSNSLTLSVPTVAHFHCYVLHC